MQEEKELIDTLIEKDIYRQFAMTAIAINKFIFDGRSEKYSLVDAQQEANLLAMIADQYIEKRGDEADKTAIKALKTKHKEFIVVNGKPKTDKDHDFYTSYKTNGQAIIDEYYRLCIKTGIFGKKH